MYIDESDTEQNMFATSLGKMPTRALDVRVGNWVQGLEIPEQVGHALPHRIGASNEGHANDRQQRDQCGSDERIYLRTPLEGQQIGNYTLLRQIGRGGYASIYLGMHTYLGTRAALKLVNLYKTSRDDLQSFQFEARLLAHLRHRHIVRALDFGWEGGTPYLVMAYAPGGTLRQRFPARVPLPLGAVLPAVMQIASALQYAHNHRLIHCDVKPANVLLGPHNEIWLGDFGIAITTKGKRPCDPGVVKGTAEYLAPEQISGHPLPASDQYALGVMVYQWLCGELPFQGTTLHMCLHHLSTPPPRLRDRAPSISRPVESVVMKAMTKDPSRRFAHVLEFARALERASQE
jgi:serine/threonine protein kinase